MKPAGVPGRALAVALLVLGLGALLVRTAWLCDDAFITFRAVDNLVHGRGPTWNPDERVQAFSNPLWMLLLAGAARVTGEIPTTAMVVSMVVSLLAAGLLGGRTRAPLAGAAAALFALASSKSFVDYSTSGLENPLTHLLLVGLCLSLERERREPRDLFLPALLGALAFVNRADALLLWLPALAWLWLRLSAGRGRGLLFLAAGFLPALAWEVFSVVYYGFPVPNTAYAKLVGGIPRSEYLAQGLRYLVRSSVLDPIAPAVLLGGALAGLASRDGRRVALAAGALTYTGYVVWIGGDFMGGRHLTAPLLVGAYLLARAFERLATGPALAVAGALLYLGLLNPAAPVRSGADYGYGTTAAEATDAAGITDERAIYYRATGLARLGHELGPPVETRGAAARLGPAEVRTLAYIGVPGYLAGPDVHIVDPHGLSDPLLARIPRVARNWLRDGELTWRIGHLRREPPPGYLRSLETGENHIEDPDLARYWDKLKLVTRGPLFSPERWREILAFNTGRNDALLDAYLRALDAASGEAVELR